MHRTLEKALQPKLRPQRVVALTTISEDKANLETSLEEKGMESEEEGETRALHISTAPKKAFENSEQSVVQQVHGGGLHGTKESVPNDFFFEVEHKPDPAPN